MYAFVATTAAMRWGIHEPSLGSLSGPSAVFLAWLVLSSPHSIDEFDDKSPCATAWLNGSLVSAFWDFAIYRCT